MPGCCPTAKLQLTLLVVTIIITMLQVTKLVQSHNYWVIELRFNPRKSNWYSMNIKWNKAISLMYTSLIYILINIWNIKSKYLIILSLSLEVYSSKLNIFWLVEILLLGKYDYFYSSLLYLRHICNIGGFPWTIS